MSMEGDHYCGFHPLKKDFSEMCDRYYGFQREAGKSADPRTLRLLEFFRQLYHRRPETFKKMLPSGLQAEFVELFNKIGASLKWAKSKSEVRTMQRSLSAGSRRSPGGGSDSGLKLDRFKVRIVNGDSGTGESNVKQIDKGKHRTTPV